MSFGSGSIHEVPLQRPVIDLRSHRFHQSLLQEGIVGWEPSVGPQIHLTGRHGLVELVIVHGERSLHPIAEPLDEQPVDLGLEPTGVPGLRGPSRTARVLGLLGPVKTGPRAYPSTYWESNSTARIPKTAMEVLRMEVSGGLSPQGSGLATV